MTIEVEDATKPAKLTTSNIIGGLVIAFLLSPLSALITAFYCTTLWRWFVEAEYGGGPSMPAWYGVSAILMILVHRRDRAADKEDGPKLSALFMARTWIDNQFVYGVAMCGVAFTRFVLGWT
jgi:hypothetical protein